jgi:hypothetical protein
MKFSMTGQEKQTFKYRWPHMTGLTVFFLTETDCDLFEWNVTWKIDIV